MKCPRRLRSVSQHRLMYILLPCTFFFTCFLSLFFTVVTVHQLSSQTQKSSSPPPPPPASPPPIRSNLYRKSKKITSIALLVPVRAVPGTVDVSQLSFFQELIPSLFNAYYFDQCNKHVRLFLYVGYDAGDIFWDSRKNIEDIRTVFERKWDNIFNTRIGSFQNNRVLPPTLVIERFLGLKGSPCWIWNGLAKLAYQNGHVKGNFFLI